MSLLIEQLTAEVEKTASEVEETTEVEKTAEEAAMEKLAHEVNVLDQSRTLVSIGEEMYKIAEELENEAFAALAIDTYQLGERMGSCLTKTASEDGSALVEALEIAEDMYKVASVYAELADETQEETLCKMAEAIVAISNELTEDANQVYSELEKEASEEVTEEVEKEAGVKEVAKGVQGKLLKAYGAAKYEAGFKAMQAKELASEMAGKTSKAFKAEEARAFLGKASDSGVPGVSTSKLHQLKKLLGTKEGLKAVAPAATAYGSAAAGLAAAGYGAKKIHDKK